MIVISCFDYTTNMVRPWADAGYTCYCVDMQHPRGETREGNIIKVGANMLDWLPPANDIVFAAFFPPCTDVAVSGARWFRDKGLGALIRSLELFKRSVDLAEMIGAPYLIENPVNTVSSYWREPDHKFQPNHYGDPYTKETWLWTGNGFQMPPVIRPGDLFDRTTWVDATEGSKMHKLPPSAERANLRSETPQGFARAVFEANGIEHAATQTQA